MSDSLYPKLNRIGVVEAPWGDDVPKKPSTTIPGLLESPGDPELLKRMFAIEAALTLSIEILYKGSGEYILTEPHELAKAAGRDLTFNEYLAGLESLGLNVNELKNLADKKYLEFLIFSEEEEKKAGDAATFFSLLRDEHLVSTEQIHKFLHSSSIYKFLELVLANADTVRARLNASKRHLPKNIARDFVQEEWRVHKDSYELNKSAFARDYSRRVKNELGTDVTEKTIREVWLSDTPSASKHAG